MTPFSTTTQATDLLAEWERFQPPVSLLWRSDFLACVTEMLSCEDHQLDREDVRCTISQARELTTCCAEASGPDRTRQAISEVLARTQTQTGRVLLALISRVDAELSMDELDLILETLQASVGQDWEIMFSHSISSTQPAELRLLVLLAPLQP